MDTNLKLNMTVLSQSDISKSQSIVVSLMDGLGSKWNLLPTQLKPVCYRMLRSPQQHPKIQPMVYCGRLTPDQVAMLEAEFNKVKTLHSTDLALIAAEMAANENDVKTWYVQRIGAWRREQGLSDCFGQI